MVTAGLSRLRGLILLLAAGLALAAEVVEDGFEAGFDRWEPIDPAHWEIAEADGGHVLRLKTPGALREGVRRPGEYALLRGDGWRDVTIDARVKSLRPSTLKGRDVVVVFGWRDDTHFYYAHLSNDSNGTTHNVIMKVHGDQRTALQSPARPEARLSDGWHNVRVEHRADGTIRVFHGDRTVPLMTAHDPDYPSGRVGLGTFDDTAEFDDVKVTGERARGQ